MAEEGGEGLEAFMEGSSDCTFPDEIDLKDKKKLMNWQYWEGGQRLPVFMPKIPHVNETEVPRHIDVEEANFAELAARLAHDTKQVQQEYIFAQQKCDLLRQEKELLKWHIASNSKSVNLRRRELEGIADRTSALEGRLKAVQTEVDRYEGERRFWTLAIKKSDEAVAKLEQEYQDITTEMQEWLDRRGDFTTDTTVERRKAGEERKLRFRQWKKLNRACNADRRWHASIDSVKDADNLVVEAYDEVTKSYTFGFEKAGQVTGPIRQILLESPEADPLEGFTPTRRKVSEGGALGEEE